MAFTFAGLRSEREQIEAPYYKYKYLKVINQTSKTFNKIYVILQHSNPRGLIGNQSPLSPVNARCPASPLLRPLPFSPLACEHSRHVSWLWCPTMAPPPAVNSFLLISPQSWALGRQGCPREWGQWRTLPRPWKQTRWPSGQRIPECPEPELGLETRHLPVCRGPCLSGTSPWFLRFLALRQEAWLQKGQPGAFCIVGAEASVTGI